MSTRNTATYLEDILDAIVAIGDHLAGATFDQYQADRKTRHAVEREFQILTEAAFRLREDAAVLCPSVDWRSLRGMGNFLRHEYESVNDTIMWEAIHCKLPAIYAAVEQTLQKLQSSSVLP